MDVLGALSVAEAQEGVEEAPFDGRGRLARVAGEGDGHVVHEGVARPDGRGGGRGCFVGGGVSVNLVFFFFFLGSGVTLALA